MRQWSCNGVIKVGSGSLKSQTPEQTTPYGRIGAWNWEDLEAARLQANQLSRPRGAHKPTPDQWWSARQTLTSEKRTAFLATLVQKALGIAAGQPKENKLRKRDDDQP